MTILKARQDLLHDQVLERVARLNRAVVTPILANGDPDEKLEELEPMKRVCRMLRITLILLSLQ